jgi:hypothetical protein
MRPRRQGACFGRIIQNNLELLTGEFALFGSLKSLGFRESPIKTDSSRSQVVGQDEVKSMERIHALALYPSLVAEDL